MFAGPIFSREALTAPRQVKHFLIRSGYVAALFVLMYTAAQAMFGWQQVRSVGDVARFGSLVFQIFCLVQLSLVLFFALLLAASGVAQEKDRQTLILLLMTDLRDYELVFGKLFASLLTVMALIVVSIPVLFFVLLLGGTGMDQVIWALVICAASALPAGSWGLLVAYWREKTFQTLAVSMLGLVIFLGVVEGIVAILPAGSVVAHWVGLLDPYRVLFSILDPLKAHHGLTTAHVASWDFLIVMAAAAVVINGVTLLRLRVWNPSRLFFTTAMLPEDEAGAALPNAAAKSRPEARTRRIWANPVVWREICTKAYGRKILAIKAAYVVLAALIAFLVGRQPASGELVLGMISSSGVAFVGLCLISLIIINAQAVTAFTSERDGKTLELLLMTDVTAKEFVYGKLGGILYNTKELILIPLALAAYVAWLGGATFEQYVYVAIGFGVLVLFSAMLGLHSGLSFERSRTAIANSLGTIFFLFIGIFIFMLLLVEARSSFAQQFASFLVFILAGSIALYASLSHRNPSGALMLAAGALPFLTFYAITEFLLQGSLGVCFAISVAYGFTTLAMLVPSVSEFDASLGRTTLNNT
ncbi:MAG TPA: ABC transporter permease [Planctomycetaceae bacterium]|nr:ABC transporter permease [Planctomycetaceae bacterium]